MGLPFSESDAKPATSENSPPVIDSSEALRSSLYTRPERSPWADPSAPKELPKEVVAEAKEVKIERGAGAADKPAGKVTTNKDGYVTDIEYPNGKTRHIERDSKTQEAQSMITTTPDATTQLVNKNGKWSLTMQNLELPVAGQIEVMKNGEVNTKQPGSNVWKVEKTDGTVVDEKEDANGARLRLGADGKPSRLIRADKSMVEQPDENKIVESRAGQKDVTWTKDGDSWKADADLPARKHLKLGDDGKLSYTDGTGVKHEINTRGEETLQSDGLARISADKFNRPTQVEMQDKTRKYEYFDDNSKDVKSVTITNTKTNQTVTYTRESKDSDKWSGTNWRGEISVGSDGVHSTRTHLNGQGVNENARWDSSHPDGRSSSDVLGKDGSRTSFDKSTGEIISVRTSDGIRVDKVDSKGGSQVKYYNPKIGETVTWTKGADGKYSSDSPMFKDSRSNLSFTNAGELSYTNDKQEKVFDRPDGSKRTAQADGTMLEYSKDGQLQKSIRGTVERSFNRDGSTITSVVDRDTKSNAERTIFDSKILQGSTNHHLSETGDFSYQNPDGSAVIERASGLHLQLDKDGDLSYVSSEKAARSFRYLGEGDKKSLVSISEQARNEKGEVSSETFTRVINPDGRLASEYRSDKGSASRYHVTPCADGDYEYKTPASGDKVVAARMAR